MKTLCSAALILAMAGCGDLVRDNTVDPRVSGGLTLRDQLLGSWSRDDSEKNEIYFFRADGSVELWDYTSPSGGAVDRSATFPETRVRIFEGTFTLVGNLLRMVFTRADSNDPGEIVQPPSAQLTAEISIARNTLTLTGTTGTFFYPRLQ